MSDTPIIVSNYPSDQFSVHMRSPHWHKIVAVTLGILAFGGYVSLNMWLFTLGKIQKNEANHKDIPFGARIGTGATVLGETQERPTPPSPAPSIQPSAPSSFRAVKEAPPTSSLPGSGGYACDRLGTCNLYKNPLGAGCPVTFADPRCLSQCNNPKNQCKE